MSKIDHPTLWTPSPRPVLSSTQKRWLMRAGALTQGLRAFGTLDLRVLAEYPAGLTQDEASGLQRPARSPVWIREVAMRINDVDCVVARSVTPLVASHSIWHGMRMLRSRPLADILYHDRSIIRSAFEVCQVNRTIPIYRTSLKVLEQNASTTEKPATPLRHALLARRSVFWRQNTPLLVAECFLPAFWNVAQVNLSHET
jgi:chorismate--pyruvate lyase